MADKDNVDAKTLNPNEVSFLEPPIVTDQQNSRGFHTPTHEFRDPWGRPYRVYMDSNFDEEVRIPPGYTGDSGRPFIRKSVIVYSAGPDGKFETVNDNVTTWTKARTKKRFRWTRVFE